MGQSQPGGTHAVPGATHHIIDMRKVELLRVDYIARSDFELVRSDLQI